MSRDLVTNMLRALQRRLWLERSLFRLRAGIWIGSSFLLAIGAVSVLWFPVAPHQAVLAAVSVVIIVILSAISLRPPLKACALRADRQFGSDLLLTTALETLASPRSEIPAAGRVVLQQATDTVPRWRQQLDSVWHAPALSSFALAAIPTFAAALLLSFSTYRDVGASANGADGEPTAAGNAGEYLLEDGKDLLALRESIVRDASLREDAQSVDEAAADGKLIAPDDAASRGDDDGLQLADSKAASTGLAAEGPAGGGEAGDAQPAMQARKTPPQAEGESFARRSTVEIARLGASHASSRESDGEFAAAASAAAEVRVRARPAAAPPALSAWTTLTPAEVAYAQRYLNRTEPQHD